MEELWKDDQYYDLTCQARMIGHLPYKDLQPLILEIGLHLHESRNQFTIYDTHQQLLNILRLLHNTVMSILELCCRSPAILQFTALADSTNYTDHSRSPILYFGDLYQ